MLSLQPLKYERGPQRSHVFGPYRLLPLYGTERAILLRLGVARHDLQSQIRLSKLLPLHWPVA